ncbi:MAG: SDR family oxidoreductase [Methylophilaceae bacterium]
MSQILVTGANRGLGLEFVHQFLNRGDHVIATCRNPETADQLHDLQNLGPLEIYRLDVGNQDQVNALQKQLAHLPIDILINNAGIWRGSQLGHISIDEWMESFRINSIAPIHMIQTFLPNLETGKDKKVISITSKMGSIDDNTSGGSYIYRSSKTALNSAMQSMRHDLTPKGIATCTLHPGWVRTDMGGPGGWIDVHESVSGMIKVIDQLSLKNTGQYIDYAGKIIPW